MISPDRVHRSPSVGLPPFTRRRFLAALAAAGVGEIVSCKSASAVETASGDAHLTARVSAPTETITPGLRPLGIGGARDAMLYVPASYQASEPLPLVVLLHGAGGSAMSWFGSYSARGDANRFIMLAPDSRNPTWDAVTGSFDVDVNFINQALLWTFQHCAVDASRIVLAGFSDGATYALSLGLANGDLFNRVIAYSPGFYVESTFRGKPPIFISHGVNDPILPINSASRRLVPFFEGKGYTVQYTEFAGGHEVPATISDAAMSWLKSAWR